MPKNVQTIIQLHSYYMPAKCSKAIKLGLNNTPVKNSQMYKLDLEDTEEQGSKIASVPWIIKTERKFQKNIYFCCINYAKAFDCVDHHKLWKILKEVENSERDGNTRLPDLLLRNLFAVQKTTVRTGYGSTDCFQIRKVYIKVVYCHSAYLTYMQNTSCKRWMKHKLESRFLREISKTSDVQMTPPLWQKAKKN